MGKRNDVARKASGRDVQGEDGGSPEVVPRSQSVAEKGIHTTSDLSCMLSALIADTLSNRVSVPVANATCNATGKLLKTVELRHKYASVPSENDEPEDVRRRGLNAPPDMRLN